ncbi:hypothetical protein Tco_1026411 [Tanacetum coccineum]
MSNMSEDIQYAGSDTRPPMLDRTDFESWQQRIRLYCLGKDNGENIMKSITEGPFQMGTMRDTLTEGGEGALHLGPERARVFADLSAEQKDRYKADIRATNIILQGIPKDIYSLINHYTDAKDIWDNVKMILEGSELTKDDRESQLYDEFEHFCQIKGETIHVYYVRFTKLINDMRNIKMTMSRMQLNSKFVNNMLPEWSRFITEVKLNRGLKESNFDQLYAYLKQHEVHANENRMMMERFIQPTNDPLALVSNASVQKYPTQSSESPQSSNQPSIADNFQLDTGSTSTDNLIESLTNTLALLNQSFKAHLPQMNNQLRTSSNARNNATVQDGQSCCSGCSRRSEHEMANVNLGKLNLFMLLQLQRNWAEKGIHSTRIAVVMLSFDSNVDEAPTTQTMFMANLTSEESGPSYDSNTLFECRIILEETKNIVVQINVSSVRKDALMSILDEMHEQGVAKVVREEAIILKKDFKQKEDKFLEEFLDIKRLKEKVEDRLYKQDQSVQTVHMICKPKSYYDEKNKVAIGYQNPLYLTRAMQVQPALYNGHVLVMSNHARPVVHDSEDTRDMAEITRK